MRKLLAFLFCLLSSPSWAQVGAAPLYPAGAAPLTAATTATTGAMTVTLGGVPGRTTYICGWHITSAGTTAGIAVAATITGIITVGTLPLTYAFVSSGQGFLAAALPLCIPASGQNTQIVVTVPGGGAGTTASLFAWGFQL
jgi:hypothetical protein